MVNDDRIGILKRLLFNYVKSSSLWHNKDSYMLTRVSENALSSKIPLA
jgi:hypothetical protein